MEYKRDKRGKHLGGATHYTHTCTRNAFIQPASAFAIGAVELDSVQPWKRRRGSGAQGRERVFHGFVRNGFTFSVVCPIRGLFSRSILCSIAFRLKHFRFFCFCRCSLCFVTLRSDSRGNRLGCFFSALPPYAVQMLLWFRSATGKYLFTEN